MDDKIATLIIVDAEAYSELTGLLSPEHYELLFASSPHEARVSCDASIPDIVLVSTAEVSQEVTAVLELARDSGALVLGLVRGDDPPQIALYHQLINRGELQRFTDIVADLLRQRRRSSLAMNPAPPDTELEVLRVQVAQQAALIKTLTARLDEVAWDAAQAAQDASSARQELKQVSAEQTQRVDHQQAQISELAEIKIMTPSILARLALIESLKPDEAPESGPPSRLHLEARGGLLGSPPALPGLPNQGPEDEVTRRGIDEALIEQTGSEEETTTSVDHGDDDAPWAAFEDDEITRKHSGSAALPDTFGPRVEPAGPAAATAERPAARSAPPPAPVASEDAGPMADDPIAPVASATLEVGGVGETWEEGIGSSRRTALIMICGVLTAGLMALSLYLWLTRGPEPRSAPVRIRDSRAAHAEPGAGAEAPAVDGAGAEAPAAHGASAADSASRPDSAAGGPDSAGEPELDAGAGPEASVDPPKTEARPRPAARRRKKRRARARLRRVRLNMAAAHIRKRRHREARRLLTLALRAKDDYRVRRLLSWSHKKAGEPWPAIHHLKRALALAPGRRRASLQAQLGELYLKVGKKTHACKALAGAAAGRSGSKRAAKLRKRHCSP